ncbi:DUF4251 domain-containing protein [Ulvibacterium marinum]|uniref:DUF4251 domain-containing protein n=1 Tax=Ulvibacterium marinum TaxID=2419782 RepID=UPI00249525FD|nr:DUF4251 domain-containing protein [Ulvibacterium marinum]
MKKVSLVSVLILLFFYTLLGQNELEQKQLREKKSKIEYTQIKKLVESKLYKFEVQRVSRVRSSPINFMGEGYYLTVTKDSVNTHLPYFGVRHSGGGSGESSGIEFNGLMENYKVEYDDSKKRIIVKFIGRNTGESLDITLSIFKNGSSQLSVRSSHRSSMNYSGKLIKS